MKSSQLIDLKGWSASKDYLIEAHSSYEGNKNKYSLQCDSLESGYYTAQFSFHVQSNAPNDYFIRGLAEVIWSVEGNSHRRLLHVTNGSAISGSGQGVRIVLQDQSLIVSEPTLPAKVTSCITLIKGIRTGLQPPIFTPEFPGATEPAATREFQIPYNAGINSVYFSLARDNNTDVWGNAVTIQGSYMGSTWQLGFDSFNQWLPLPPGISVLIVTNNTANNIDVFPIYGVEG
jgi:hypothetical protein